MTTAKNAVQSGGEGWGEGGVGGFGGIKFWWGESKFGGGREEGNLLSLKIFLGGGGKE